MGENHLPRVPSPILVLAAIVKLHNPRKSYTACGVFATREHIQQVLENIYHRKLTLRQIDNVLGNLQKQGLIFKERGLLRKKHMVIYGIKSHRIFQEAFTLIKLDSARAYVVNNSYEGVMHNWMEG